MDNVLIREYLPSDRAFITKTFGENSYHSGVNLKGMTASTYFSYFNPALDVLFDRNPNILVACYSEDPNTIFGYILGESPNILHFMYVKVGYRTQGIAAKLVEEYGKIYGLDLDRIVFTTYTKTTPSLVRKCPKSLYDPFVFWLGE